MIKEFASYADDNVPFLVGDHLNDVILKLQSPSKTLFKQNTVALAYKQVSWMNKIETVLVKTL